ncbi:MAG: hypothetical protein ACTH6S_07450 [Mesonia sp.]|uniref:hypothetical protein n=1 Tax=Mesonia sp. TaxID=1960830 RepID=UPI003F9E75EF
MKEYYIIKPSSLNLEQRLEKFPPDFKFCKEYALWLISEIIRKTAYKLENKEEDIWVPLCSIIAKKHPYSYRKHLRYLCDNFPNVGNVLFRKEYTKGSCYSYRLSPYFFGEEIEIKKITDKKMLKFLRRGDYLESNSAFKKNYNFLGKYFNEKLTIQTTEASEKNKTLFGNEFDYRKHLFNAVQICDIANKEFSIKYTYRTDGRLHHQLTRLSKPFRQFLRYDGKKLAECDVSASVPTMLSYLLVNMVTGSTHLDNVINSNKYYYRHYMFCKKAVDLINSEIALFAQKVLSGKFYELFINDMHTIHHFDTSLQPDEYFLKNVREICGHEFEGNQEDLRKVMKTKILAMFNAKPKHYLNEEAVFGIYFPSILKWIKTFKKSNHKYFSYLTLQLESYFMLNIVARQFNNKFRGKKPLFTLHDCLITTEDNIDELHIFMKEALSEALNFTPILKVEVWE